MLSFNNVRARLLLGIALIAAPSSSAIAQRATIDTLPCAAALSASGSHASAHTGADTSRSATRSNRPVDVVIYAAATAREVTFATQPDIHVRLCGGLDSIHVLDRRNLPSPVVAGHTYRDVYVAVQIFGRLNADCISQTITGRAGRDSSGAARPPLDCASLELRGTSSSSRAPADSTNSPRPPRS